MRRTLNKYKIYPKYQGGGFAYPKVNYYTGLDQSQVQNNMNQFANKMFDMIYQKRMLDDRRAHERGLLQEKRAYDRQLLEDNRAWELEKLKDTRAWELDKMKIQHENLMERTDYTSQVAMDRYYNQKVFEKVDNLAQYIPNELTEEFQTEIMSGEMDPTEIMFHPEMKKAQHIKNIADVIKANPNRYDVVKFDQFLTGAMEDEDPSKALSFIPEDFESNAYKLKQIKEEAGILGDIEAINTAGYIYDRDTKSLIHDPEQAKIQLSEMKASEIGYDIDNTISQYFAEMGIDPRTAPLETRQQIIDASIQQHLNKAIEKTVSSGASKEAQHQMAFRLARQIGSVYSNYGIDVSVDDTLNMMSEIMSAFKGEFHKSGDQIDPYSKDDIKNIKDYYTHDIETRTGFYPQDLKVFPESGSVKYFREPKDWEDLRDYVLGEIKAGGDRQKAILERFGNYSDIDTGSIHDSWNPIKGIGDFIGDTEATSWDDIGHRHWKKLFESMKNEEGEFVQYLPEQTDIDMTRFPKRDINQRESIFTTLEERLPSDEDVAKESAERQGYVGPKLGNAYADTIAKKIGYNTKHDLRLAKEGDDGISIRRAANPEIFAKYNTLSDMARDMFTLEAQAMMEQYNYEMKWMDPGTKNERVVIVPGPGYIPPPIDKNSATIDNYIQTGIAVLRKNDDGTVDLINKDTKKLLVEGPLTEDEIQRYYDLRSPERVKERDEKAKTESPYLVK